MLIACAHRVGVHAFIVPIRSLESHMPLPGVTVGDIGPKLGTDSNDNGYLRLNHVRVPRDHMLMGFAKVRHQPPANACWPTGWCSLTEVFLLMQVDREGRYSKPAHDKIAYFGMLYIRASLVEEASRYRTRTHTTHAARCFWKPT
jgi:hypothetical protein